MDKLDEILRPLLTLEEDEKIKLLKMIQEGVILSTEQSERLQKIIDDSRQTTAKSK